MDEGIKEQLYRPLHEWLGDDGINFFREIVQEFGDPAAVLHPGHRLNNSGEGIPHPIHFREGMQIRNFLNEELTRLNLPRENLDEEWRNIVLVAIAYNFRDHHPIELPGNRLDKVE